MRAPEAGELTHRMQVRKRTDKTHGPGLISEFTSVCKRWVKVEPLGTATYANGQQTGHKATHRLYCRFVRELDSAHEFVEAGRVFRVLRPTAMGGRNVWSVVEVEELGPAGEEGGQPRGKLSFD
ncbi:head-tail adaptor protein [Pseudomonas japonica]|uniref:head-tail adaptor protein n=1 Tax=Pseudomonas japonica TaxID=256466 RepID=UPI003A890395